MPMFVLTCHDIPDSAPLRAANRPAHLEYLWGRGAEVVLAGALMDATGETPRGSQIVLELPDEAAVQAFADGDPYHLAGVFARREVARLKLAPPAPDAG